MRTEGNETKMKTPKQVSNEVLDAAAKVARNIPGGLTLIAAELSRRTGEGYNRAEIHRWLNPTHESRIEPKLGIAVMLCASAEEVARKHFGRKQNTVGLRTIVALRRNGVGRIPKGKAQP